MGRCPGREIGHFLSTTSLLTDEEHLVFKVALSDGWNLFRKGPSTLFPETSW